MKRKFSFSLAPLKIPSRTENKALKEALSAKEYDTSPISPPLSPLINRRPLDSRTESQLYAACAVIVECYPGGDETPLNFTALHKTSKAQKAPHAPAPTKHRSQSTSHLSSTLASSVKHHSQHSNRSEGALKYNLPESKSAQSLAPATIDRRYDHKHTVASARELQEAQRFPPRSDSYVAQPPRANFASPFPISPMSRPKTAPGDSSEISYGTPMSTSTDHFNYISTAITSAALTPARVSKHASKQFVLDNDSYQAAISEADTEAAVWMRAEHERRRNVRASQDSEAPKLVPRRRPSQQSNSKSWTTEIREKIRPRTSSSRSASRESQSRVPSDSTRSPSAQGWRSWGNLQRKSSKSSLVDQTPAREPSLRGKADRVEAPRKHDHSVTVVPAVKKEIDLNRELPPLPSLDTWQESAPQPAPSAHIASLMRDKGKSQTRKSRQTMKRSTSQAQLQTASAVVVICKTDSGDGAGPTDSSDPFYQPEAPSSFLDCPPESADSERKTPDARESIGARSKTSTVDSCFSPSDSVSPGPGGSIELNRVNEHMKNMEAYFSSSSTSNLSHGRTQSSITTAPPTRPMTRDGKTTNFSRKISIDNYGRIHDSRCQNIVEITALPQMPAKKNEKFTALKRVLSKLELRDKSHKPVPTWMDEFEKDGVKTGVMIQTDRSPAPVVQY